MHTAGMGTSKAAPAGRRTAVIVGASSGIGKEVALKLSGRGWRVYNLSRTPLSSERVKTMTADAAREGELRRAILDIGTECGNLDLLVYSAGFSMAAPIEYAAAGDYRYLFEVNYFGAVEAMKAALPFLKKRGGRMILIGSMGGELPVPFDAFYSSSKAALAMLAREADMELRPVGVRVSTIPLPSSRQGEGMPFSAPRAGCFPSASPTGWCARNSASLKT